MGPGRSNWLAGRLLWWKYIYIFYLYLIILILNEYLTYRSNMLLTMQYVRRLYTSACFRIRRAALGVSSTRPGWRPTLRMCSIRKARWMTEKLLWQLRIGANSSNDRRFKHRVIVIEAGWTRFPVGLQMSQLWYYPNSNCSRRTSFEPLVKMISSSCIKRVSKSK